MNAGKKTRVVKPTSQTLSLGIKQIQHSLPLDVQWLLFEWCTPGDLGTFARCSRACLDMVQTWLSQVSRIAWNDFRTPDDAYTMRLLGQQPANRLREFHCELPEEVNDLFLERMTALLLHVIDRHRPTLEDFSLTDNGGYDHWTYESTYQSVQTQVASCPKLREFQLSVDDMDGSIGRCLIATGHRYLKTFRAHYRMADKELTTLLRAVHLEELELCIHSPEVGKCLLKQVTDRQLRRLARLTLRQSGVQVPNEQLVQFCCQLPSLKYLTLEMPRDTPTATTYTMPVLEEFCNDCCERGALDHVILHLPQAKSFIVSSDCVTADQLKHLIRSSPQLTVLQEFFTQRCNLQSREDVASWRHHLARDTDVEEVFWASGILGKFWPEVHRLGLERPVPLQIMFPALVHWQHLRDLSLVVDDYGSEHVDVTRNILLPLPQLRHLALQHAKPSDDSQLSWWTPLSCGRWMHRPYMSRLTHAHLQTLTLNVGDDSVFRSWSFPELMDLTLGPGGYFETLGMRTGASVESLPILPKLQFLSLRKLVYVDATAIAAFVHSHAQQALKSVILEECVFKRNQSNDHFLLHLATGPLPSLQEMVYKQRSASVDALAAFVRVVPQLQSLTLLHDIFTANPDIETQLRAVALLGPDKLRVEFESLWW